MCNPLLLSCSCILMKFSSSAVKIRKMFRKVKQAPTNLEASKRKITFKHSLTDFMRLMKDTVVYPFQQKWHYG